MRIATNVELGVATHTGRVRSANEDDFLLYAPQTEEELFDRGWFLAIADGMGGAMGGAEASRTAVRAAVRPHVRWTTKDSVPRMEECFDAAVRDVYEASIANPSLRDMGTTLTILNYLSDRMILGHVGDTRCLRLRDGTLEQLSEDHAVTEPESFLTRCVGAGQSEVVVDVSEFDVVSGDQYVLATDGLWGVVPEADIASAIERLAPQAAAEALVEEANRRGGPDNITIIILNVADTPEDVAFREIELPSEEVRQRVLIGGKGRSLMPPRWPWLVMAMGASMLVLSALRVGLFGVTADPVGYLIDLLR